ncbi:RagB/SusD family nutrient uptake outer membrane protein [Mangrovibacterium diazotrophicum]|uniref:Putative outer membrane starch-binding protein n=1 Tax=Mangrovibacterium diazotrophicum TaxID=1261403 RepID=A0A419W7B6_9BACT|nr:RagB/SusD family nutrient uptake outer membrane protein [Mangrovibacterium diazotrophicum]RKD91335.1 putative outer membrane starch-binding protein [Mangrovibacterium diazotrophicum]
MKKIYSIILIIGLGLGFFSSCSDMLDQSPDNILTNEEVFKDWNMIQSVLANYYGRVKWGQRIGDDWQYIYLDEACNSSGGPDYTQNFGDAHWRVFDYGLIRNINQFLEGIRSDAAADLTTDQRSQIEGEARFLRAWTYFNMVRCMGGMPIVGDEVFEYNQGMDVAPLQIPRSTEAESYDYVISECDAIFDLLPGDKTTNSARVNKWTALALKARAAIYAASLSKYNNELADPIMTSGNEVGIPASLSEGYYQIAYNTAKQIIDESPYMLQDQLDDKARNFYETTSVKDNNVEVMWTNDYIYPGQTTQFTTRNIPRSIREDMDGTIITPILNLVEAYEYTNDRDGELATMDTEGDYVFYDKPQDIYANKDARLWGTVIYGGSSFKGKDIVFQAGQKHLVDGVWTDIVDNIGSKDDDGLVITAEDGPTTSNDQNVNKTGFCIRKFLDETVGAGTRGRGSEMWFVNFRYAESVLIAAEAAMELGDQTNAVKYINQIRTRAGIQSLSSVTLDDIINENRVEFAFENHRYWDLKRWRKAHILWNGIEGDPTATHYALFPYLINEPGNPNDGKWVFDKQKAHMSVYPRYFQMKNYYNFIDQDWINRNPQLVKNPYQ